MVMKGRAKRQIGKVIKGLDKASKTHAQQAKTLKKVKKMGIGGRALAGSLSPLYGIATGEGAFGNIGAAGMLSRAIRKAKDAGEDIPEVQQNPRNQQVDEKGRPIANPAPRAAQLGTAKRFNKGGDLAVGKAISRNLDSALKGNKGFFGNIGQAFSNALGDAMKGAAGDLSGVKQNPRNQQVDEKGNPVNNPAPRAARLAPAKPMRSGGATKTGRKKPNPKTVGAGSVSKAYGKIASDLKKIKKPTSVSAAFSKAGDIARREKGFSQPRVEATATARRDRRALDGIALRGSTKGIMK